MAHRDLKDRIYPHFARVARALASDRRLELVDLLAQAPRHVEALAAETGMPVANVSQHLQVLKNARLVESTRERTRIIYRLAGDDVLRLWISLRAVAEARLAELAPVTAELEGAGATEPRATIARLVRDGDAVLIDVRPAEEFVSGHIPGAVSLPIDELPERIETLPRDRRIVAYCRGRYCLFADEAVALLRARGFDAVRLDGGWPEWRAEGRPAAASSPPTTSRRS